MHESALNVAAALATRMIVIKRMDGSTPHLALAFAMLFSQGINSVRINPQNWGFGAPFSIFCSHGYTAKTTEEI